MRVAALLVGLAAGACACNAIWGLDGFDYAAGDGGAAASVSASSSSASSASTIASSGAGGAGGIGGAGGAGGVAVTWYDDAFAARLPLTLDNPTGSTLTAVPVLVVLDTTRIDYTAVASDGADLRFVADDHTTLLSHEIELWDPNGRSLIWVKVPSVPPGASTAWLYFDGGDAPDVQNVPDVWTKSYVAVFHMSPGVADATGDGHDSTASGTDDVAGQIHRAHRFGGGTDRVDVALPDDFSGITGGNGATFEMWISPEGFGGGNYGRLIDKSNDYTGKDGWAIWTNDDAAALASIGFARDHLTDPAIWLMEPASIALDTWQYVVVTHRDGDAPRMYLDGVLRGVSELQAGVGTIAPDVAAGMTLGARTNGGDRGFHGSLDEVRLSNGRRGADWITLQHRSMTDQLITYGATESAR